MKSTTDEPYDKYVETFRDGRYAAEYTNSYNLRSTRDLKDWKKGIGWLIAKLEVEAIQSLLHKCNGSTVLDVPCGSGKVVSGLTSQGFTVTGLDSSSDMLLRIPQADSRNIHIVKGNILALPFKDSSFDIVLCHRFLHRIPLSHRGGVLSEIHRVCKESLIVYYGVTSGLTDLITRFERISGMGDRGVIHYVSKNSVMNELGRNGFSYIDGKYVLPIASTGYLAAARREKESSRDG